MVARSEKLWAKCCAMGSDIEKGAREHLLECYESESIRDAMQHVLCHLQRE